MLAFKWWWYVVGEWRRNYNLFSTEIFLSSFAQLADPAWQGGWGSYECRHRRHTYDHHISADAEIFSAKLYQYNNNNNNNNNNIYSWNPLALVVFSGALQFYAIHLSQSSAKSSLCQSEAPTRAYYFWNRCGNLCGGESMDAFVSRDTNHSTAPGSSHRH